MQRKRSQNLGRTIDMKQYTVEITNEALADMDQLYNHIAYALQAPENAMNQYNRIADAILTLDTMAERICIMESEPERSKEMRRLLIDNYSVFFVIQGDKVIVTNQKNIKSGRDIPCLIWRLIHGNENRKSVNHAFYYLSAFCVFASASFMARTFSGRPNSVMNPLASWWS